MKKKFFLLIPLLLFLFNMTVFAEGNTDESDSKEFEFPQWALYVRRAEIVTLGSLPFTTLGVTAVFGAYQYFSGQTSSFPNPFDKNSPAFSVDNIKIVLGISFSISAVIGLVDLIITIVKNNNESKRLQKIMDTSSIITIVPATDEEIEKILDKEKKRNDVSTVAQDVDGE